MIKLQITTNSFFVFLLIIISACSTSTEPQTLTSQEILQKSIEYHDPNNNWQRLNIHLHIQEPRIDNPERYSIVKLNNRSDAFELIRNRNEHISRHVIDSEGKPTVLFNENENIPPELVAKYRLNPDRNFVYRDFYKMLYGLPMTLNDATIKAMGQVESTIYNGEVCHQIPLELKEEMFSKHWVIYIAKSNFTYCGMEIIFPDDNTKGERLYFDGEVNLDKIKIARYRHWHTYPEGKYSGSDIVVKDINPAQ